MILGVAALAFFALSISNGPPFVIFACIFTFALICLMVYQQFSDLRAAALSLHESEERLRLLISEVQDCAIFGVAPDGKVTTWNQGAERVTGYAEREILGKPYSMLRAPEPGKTEFSAEVFEKSRRDGRYQEEAWYQSKDGRRFLALTAITPLLSPRGEPRGFSIVMCDVTTRKQAEHELFESYRFIERITDTIPDIVYIGELEKLRKVYINDEACSILGYSKQELSAFGDELFLRLLHPDDLPKFADLRERLRGLKDGYSLELECRMKHNSGDWRVLNCRTVVFTRAADGTPTQCLIIAQDTTALKQAQENAKRIESAAAEQQRLAVLGEFSASVAHEFRNPMQGVISCIEELRSQMDGDETLATTVGLLEEGVQRMDRISARLLRLARSQESEKVPYDIAQCIEGTCAFVRSRAQHGKIELKTQIEPNLPPVPMMPDRLSEALLNLLGNALDACQENGRITLSALRCTTVPDMLELRVSDTGTGIPPNARDRIFDMFFSTKPAGKGTGLGMAIVRRNIEAHGGTIELFETSSRGTTFRALIPLR
ncbi:MAG TPA: PAS domain S-box protein [Planctomycetota bacterium]|nr:PAS domain S-box protein [Planctomycetota bacterium]